MMRTIGGRATERLVAGVEYRVLSLHPEWAWEIIFVSKSVEYRTWATKYRGRLLIHASTHASPPQYPRSVILGSVELVECVETDGEFDWMLREPRALEVPVRDVAGKLKVWRWVAEARHLEGSWEGMTPDEHGRPPGADAVVKRQRSKKRPAVVATSQVTVTDLSPNGLLEALRAVTPENDGIERPELLVAVARRLGFVLTESAAEWTNEAIDQAIGAGVLQLTDQSRVRRSG